MQLSAAHEVVATEVASTGSVGGLQGGLQEWDTVMEVDGAAVEAGVTLPAALASLPPAPRRTLTVLRHRRAAAPPSRRGRGRAPSALTAVEPPSPPRAEGAQPSAQPPVQPSAQPPAQPSAQPPAESREPRSHPPPALAI